MESTAWLSVHLLQDKYDDMLIGVKSTALKFGDNTKLWLTGFGTTMVSLLVLTGRMCDQTWPYYSAVSLTAAHIAHQVGTVSSKTHGGQLLAIVHLIPLTICSFYDRFCYIRRCQNFEHIISLIGVLDVIVPLYPS